MNMSAREWLAMVIDFTTTLLATVVGILAFVTWSRHGFQAAIPEMTLSTVLWISSEQMGRHWGEDE